MNNFLLGISAFFITSIYSLSITDVNGNTISLSAFQGKKIMLVNIATGSDKVAQLAGLQQLHQQYHDSLIIIAFPSASFGHETRSNSEIKQFCHCPKKYSSRQWLATNVQLAGKCCTKWCQQYFCIE